MDDPFGGSLVDDRDGGGQGVLALINAGVQIVQPDIVKTGGFTGMQQMAALAHAYGVDLLPHQTQPTIGHTANLHMMASILHGHHPCECNDLTGRQNVVLKSPVLPKDGIFRLTDQPGLGLEFDDDQLAKLIQDEARTKEATPSRASSRAQRACSRSVFTGISFEGVDMP